MPSARPNNFEILGLQITISGYEMAIDALNDQLRQMKQALQLAMPPAPTNGASPGPDAEHRHGSALTPSTKRRDVSPAIAAAIADSLTTPSRSTPTFAAVKHAFDPKLDSDLDAYLARRFTPQELSLLHTAKTALSPALIDERRALQKRVYFAKYNFRKRLGTAAKGKSAKHPAPRPAKHTTRATPLPASLESLIAQRQSEYLNRISAADRALINAAPSDLDDAARARRRTVRHNLDTIRSTAITKFKKAASPTAPASNKLSTGMKSYWASMTPKERSREIKRRMDKRRQQQQSASNTPVAATA